MKITFFGAVNGVTGSRHLITTEENKKILIDCGLFQGSHEEELHNWDDFEIDPKSIDAVLITHSHIDHIGLLPKLVRDGFNSPIYATEPTRDFANIFLPDSARHLAKTALYLNKPNLYEETDIPKTINLFKSIDYHKRTEIFPNVFITFYDAGHILGSAIIRLEADGKSIIFSGDLGNPPVPIIKDTEFVHEADYVVIESTYGDKTHSIGKNRIDELENVIEDAFTKDGSLLIPAFAMERTQELLYELNELTSSHRIPQVPIYIDSPLANAATEIYPKYTRYFDEEAKKMIEQNKNIFSFPGLKVISDVESSKAIDHDSAKKIIIAGSGMSTGGRIVYHEMHYLPDIKNTLLIIGYQVAGTLGRKLLDGEKHISIHHTPVEVKANIVSLDAYSAHADQPKLIYWLSELKPNLKKVFLVHGEANAKIELQTKIKDELGYDTIVPIYKYEEEL